MTTQRERLLKKFPKVTHFRINWQEQEAFNFKELGKPGMDVLEFLMYKSFTRAADKDGWISFSKKAIQKATHASPYEQDIAISKLESLHILEKKLKNSPATLHYRIRFSELTNPDKLANIYSDLDSEREKELIAFFSAASEVTSDRQNVPR